MSSSSSKNKIRSFILPKKEYFISEKRILKSYSNKNLINKNNLSVQFSPNKKEKTKIIWSEGGKEVFLTGNFCNWNKFYLMKKDSKDEYFYFILYLSKGLHQFKFKVDGQWRNSSLYPKLNNQGNINNYFDNSSSTNYDNLTKSTVESSVISTTHNNIFKINVNNNKKKINENNNKNININFFYSNKNFCNYYPKINEMREYADIKPCHFQSETYHGVNQNQNKIGNKNYLFLKEKNIFCGNDSYKDIERKEHAILNHLFQKQKNKNSKLINSITIKYRHKNCTFLYYK